VVEALKLGHGGISYLIKKIDDYLHKASRNIIDYAVETSSGLIIIGENKHWKQEINTGKKNKFYFDPL